jgi:hypothetical protein
MSPHNITNKIFLYVKPNSQIGFKLLSTNLKITFKKSSEFFSRNIAIVPFVSGKESGNRHLGAALFEWNQIST